MAKVRRHSYIPRGIDEVKMRKHAEELALAGEPVVLHDHPAVDPCPGGRCLLFEPAVKVTEWSGDADQH